MTVGTVEAIARFVGEALAPVKDRLTPAEIDGLLAELGLVLPEGLTGQGGIPNALNDGATAAGELQTALPALSTAIDAADADDPASIAVLLQAAATVLQKIVALITAISALSIGLRQVATGLPAADRQAVEDFAGVLAGRVLEFLVLAHVDRRAPQVSPMLNLVGLVEDRTEEGGAASVSRPHRVRRIRLKRFARALTDPARYLREVYHWGEPGFTGIELFRPVRDLMTANDFAATLIEAPGQLPVLDAFLVRLVADPSTNPPGMRFRLRLPATEDFSQIFPLGGPWSVAFNAQARFDPGLEGTFSPDGRFHFVPPTATSTANVKVTAALGAAKTATAPLDLIGISGTTRLQADRITATAGIDARWSPPAAVAEPAVSFDVEKLTAIMDMADGDSFLRGISGGGSGRADVSVSATWSPSAGVRFSGSSALEIAIPAHASIGPATLETVYLRAGLEGDAVPVEISAALRGELGPLTASVDRIGVTLRFTAPDNGGNLGPLQVDAAFKPPNGIGLAVDGGGFAGGGYLYLDPDRGEYAGTLELKFQGIIHLKAVGILNTRLPDGSDGFSLVIIITAEFMPIQLGFGFTLIGVGGLIGINRTILFDVLRLGVRDGTLSSILFPVDVVANAPRILADIKRVFPPRVGRSLIGPMGKLGWGTPMLISLELGVLLEIPRPAFAIIGVLRLAMPAEDVAILNLQVNFAGFVDFERRELSFDASLFDSRVLTFTLTGDMAVRIYWGDNANFLLTVGGFHPAFSPPPMGLGPLRRLAIVIFQGNPSLRAEAYFAVTSNTVQFGAKIELRAGASVFNVYGFLSLDALLTFDPFHFIVQIGAMLAVRSGTSTLFSVRLDLMLEGPTPWHAKGKASFEIGFVFTVTISVRFEVTFGDGIGSVLAPVRVLDLLIEALNQRGNWSAVGHGVTPLVATRDLGTRSAEIIHPTGALAVSQKIVPLRLPIDRFGARRIDGGNQFSIGPLTSGALSIPVVPVEEQFAPAQFLAMSDAEKLSRRSFEPFEAGVEAQSSAAPRADFVRNIVVDHEVIYLRKPRQRLIHRIGRLIFDLLLRGNAVALSPLGRERQLPTGLGTASVSLNTGGFVVANTDDLQPHDATVFRSETAAVLAMKAAMAGKPELKGRLQVVSEFELAA
ncbi:MAG: DUF6603 domain-containing protein [Inquilinus sp.]|uniref:DUF6603 domain-containing protein n=1 Tax=Inquilinus sp. TaxID=1932117 RepID=UPI003F2D32A9